MKVTPVLHKCKKSKIQIKKKCLIIDKDLEIKKARNRNGNHFSGIILTQVSLRFHHHSHRKSLTNNLYHIIRQIIQISKMEKSKKSNQSSFNRRKIKWKSKIKYRFNKKQNNVYLIANQEKRSARKELNNNKKNFCCQCPKAD